MKKLVLLFTLFTLPLFSQTEMLINYGEMFDYGVFVNDSLYNTWIDTVGVDDTTAAVTSKELTLKYQYEFMTITMTDTGASYDDSVMVEFTNPDQTAWFPVHFIKDSTFSNTTQPLVDNASQHSYMVYVGNYYKIRVRLINATAVNNRVFYFTLQAAKKNRQF